MNKFKNVLAGFAAALGLAASRTQELAESVQEKREPVKKDRKHNAVKTKCTGQIVHKRTYYKGKLADKIKAMRHAEVAIVFLLIMFATACGQMDYQVGARTVCGEDPGPCVEADAGTPEADAGADAE